MLEKKNLTFVKQGKTFIILLSSHQNPMSLTTFLEQTTRLPCLCTRHSLCLECPSLVRFWETLNYPLKPSSIMTASRGPFWSRLGPIAITSPLTLTQKCLLAYISLYGNVFAHICLYFSNVCSSGPRLVYSLYFLTAQCLEYSGCWLPHEIQLNYKIATWESPIIPI